MVQEITIKRSPKISLVTLRDDKGEPVLVDGDDKILIYDSRCLDALVSVISALTGKTFVGPGRSTDYVQVLRAV